MNGQLPAMVTVRQRFKREQVADVESAVREQLQAVLPPRLVGKRIAVTAGSRGIQDIALVVRATVGVLRSQGAEPFIVPAMGSHGGATAEGQVAVLARLSVTEAYCGAPLVSSMAVHQLGTTAGGVPVFMDRHAWNSDGVILVNRIKTHTDFKADIESGVMKMAAIGLGKHAAALELHRLGIRGIRDVMQQVGGLVLASGKVLCGIGLVENAYDETAHIEVMLPHDIPAREAELLQMSKAMMPKLPVADIDLLIVDELGKNYSGTGLDTNIIGRMRISGEPEPAAPRIKYIFVRDLSQATHGNALGIGLADITTERLLKKIDFAVMNENVATSTFLSRAAIPMVMPNDRTAIETALRANWGVAPEDARVVRIANTLHLEHLQVSAVLLPELGDQGHLELSGRPEPMRFDAAGDLGRSTSTHNEP